MQSIAPLTTAQLLGKVQKMLYRFEILDDSSNWIDLCGLGGKSYLKSISLQLGGAGVTPDPIAATWSAEIHNKDGIFHPAHPTSAYKTYFRVGRKVRISIGAKYGATTKYWQRLIGWMDEPKFNHSSRSVSLSGSDYMTKLTDTTLKQPNNYWGTTETFSSVATAEVYGSEMYAEADVLDIAGEADNITNWTMTGSCFSKLTDSGGGSTYVAVIEKPNGATSCWAYNTNIGSVTQGKTYEVSFKWKSGGGSHTLTANLYSYDAGLGKQIALAQGLTSAGTTWHTCVMHGDATQTGTAGLEFKVDGASAGVAGFRIDQVSIREVTSRTNTAHAMPLTCNGVYFVTYDAGDGNGPLPMWYGDDNRGWYFDAANKVWHFDDKFWVVDGTNNIVVYYFTSQSLVNVVADILAKGPDDSTGGVGLYANRAAALAAMSYTDPAVTIPKVWFEDGATGLEAVKQVCERVNYRFWLAYDGTPTFQPAPTAGSPALDLTSWGHLAELSDYQDLTEIRNAVTIQGIERGAFSTAEDKVTSRLTSTATDGTSISAYLERDETITNNLFQDQISLDAATAARKAAFKDPKWYAELTLAYCPVPIELGDTITWRMRLSERYGWPLYAEAIYGEATYNNAEVEMTRTGIVRDIQIDGGQATYKVELVP